MTLEIRQIVKETVQETLSSLGFDLGQMHETQADLFYLRRIRKNALLIEDRVKIAIISAAIPGLLYLIWNSIRNIL